MSGKYAGLMLFAVVISVIGSLSDARATQAEARAAVMLSPPRLAHADGEQIFQHVCQGCHMPDARGATGAGTYPALAGNPHLASARFMAAVVLHGRRNMPSFMTRTDLSGFEALMHVNLSDAAIASVVNYVRSHFGNHYMDKITAADVAALHASANNESP